MKAVANAEFAHAMIVTDRQTDGFAIATFILNFVKNTRHAIILIHVFMKNRDVCVIGKTCLVSYLRHTTPRSKVNN